MQNIYGNIQGLKSTKIKQLQRLYEQQQPRDRFIISEFAQALAAIDQLFATLDPTTRKLVITEPETQERRTILLTDTVGFIHELPPPLMDAFRATLEEIIEADALLHVVDLSHPAWQSHIVSVQEILEEMPAVPEKSLIVFNKVDQVDSETLAKAQQEYPQAVFISATQHLGLETLKWRIAFGDRSVPSLQLIDETVGAKAVTQKS
jgi:GTPase